MRRLRTVAVIVCATLTSLASMASATATAATLPTKPVCVAPAKPGGGFDLTCRVAAAWFESQLKHPMQVRFMPGGIGAAAFKMYATDVTDDPNTLVAFSSGSLLNIAVGKFGAVSPDDVRFVASAGADYGVVAVSAQSSLRTFDDLMLRLRDPKMRVTIGGGGSIGSQDWVKAALLFKAAGRNPKGMRYVAFDGGGEALNNLANDNVSVYTGDVSELRSHMASNKFRILAVLADQRLPGLFRDVPTAREMGVDVTWASFRGYYMGRHVAPAAYDFYVDAFRRAHESPEFAKIRNDKGLFEFSLTGESFHRHVKTQVMQLKQLVDDADLRQ